VDVYEKYLKTVSGVKVDVSDAGSNWNVSELLKDFIVNCIRKLTFVVGLVVALSMLEVNIGPFLAAIGTVSAMSLVSTTLKSDNQVVTIPNGSIWGGIISNGAAQKPAGKA